MDIAVREPVVLTCWKDIAHYMGKGVRTVQRWEQEFDLPVSRPRGNAYKAAVVAHREDLDFWLASRWSRRSVRRPYVPVPDKLAVSDLGKSIQASRELRAANHALMHEVSSAVQALIRNCDEIRQYGTSEAQK